MKWLISNQIYVYRIEYECDLVGKVTKYNHILEYLHHGVSKYKDFLYYPNLEIIHFKNKSIIDIINEVSDIYDNFESIKQLNCSDTCNPCIRQPKSDLILSKIVSKFPNLTNIICDNIICKTNEIYPLITHLTIDRLDLNDIPLSFPNLKSLIYKNMHNLSLKFDSIFENLLYLTIIDYSQINYEYTNLHLILQKCPKLIELKINFNICLFDNWNDENSNYSSNDNSMNNSHNNSINNSNNSSFNSLNNESNNNSIDNSKDNSKDNLNVFNKFINTTIYPFIKTLILSLHYLDDFNTHFEDILTIFPNLENLKIIQECTNLNNNNLSLQMYCSCNTHKMRDKNKDKNNDFNCYLIDNFKDIYKYGKNIRLLELPEMLLTNNIIQILIDMSTQLQSLKMNTTYCKDVNEELKQLFYGISKY